MESECNKYDFQVNDWDTRNEKGILDPPILDWSKIAATET